MHPICFLILFLAQTPLNINLCTHILRVHFSFGNNYRELLLTNLNPICNCGEDIETTSHYLLHCPDYLHERKTLLNTVSCIVPNIFDFNNDQLTEILLYGKEDLDNINNTSILDATINYLIEIKIYCRGFLMNSGCHGFNIDVEKSLKRNLKSLLHSTVKENIGFTGKKLSTFSN